MTLFSCFRKSSKPSSKFRNSDSSSSTTPAIATTQAFPTPHDNSTPASPPPVYTLTPTDSKTEETYNAPVINFPANAIPRTFSNNVNVAPQTYRPPSTSSFTSTTPPHDDSEEDKFGNLRECDTVILIDDSASMTVRDCKSASGHRISRWEETRVALEKALPIVTERDPDGIDVYFLNYKSSDRGDRTEGEAGTGYRNITSGKKVKSFFEAVRPSGHTTPTGRRIRDILTPYVAHVVEMQRRGQTAKKLNILCITDGIATDNLEEDIVEFAKKLDDMGAIARQVGIQFFQVGHDKEAAEVLKELDNDLKVKHEVRDMVDTTSFGTDERGRPTLDGEAMLKFLLGALNGRLDKRQVPGRG